MYNLQARRVISSTLQRFHREALFVSKVIRRYQIEVLLCERLSSS